ncbi:MAG: GAF domain-containing protein [Chloroflexota bacterium]
MQTPKESQTSLNAVQTRRAFNISIGTGIVLLIIMALFVYLAWGEPPGPSDVRILAFAISAASFVSAWLSRRGKALYGMYLILIALYLAVLTAVFTYASVGFASGAITLVLTFVITSAVFPPRHANVMNAIALGIIALCVLLDVFDRQLPIERIRSGDPRPSWFAAGIFLTIYGVLVARQFGGYTLRTKLIIMMVTITFLASVVLTFFGVTTATGMYTENVGRGLAADAEAHGYQLGSLLEEQVKVLSTLSFNELLQQAAEEQNASYGGARLSEIVAQIEKLDQAWIAAADTDDTVQERLRNPAALDLKEFNQAFTTHSEVFITDRYGALVAATDRTSDYNQSDESWWQAAYAEGKGGSYISSSPEFDESVGEYTIFFALPLRNRETGEVIGVLRSTYSLREMIAFLETTKVGETGEADVIFPGNPPAHLHGGHYEDLDPASWEQLSALAVEPYTQATYEGMPLVMAFSGLKTVEADSAIGKLDWLVVMHQTELEALGPVYEQTSGTLLASVLIIVLASGLAAGVAQVLVVPITRLTEVAEKVGSGDLDARAQVTTGDEVGRLATTFNGMAEQLQATLQGLEQRVADRTRALETASVVSRRISTLLDQRQLVNVVVEQVQGSFDYYHAHIYLYDDKKENLLMAGGTGEAGQVMLERGHKVPRGRGLVGRAADTNMPVLVADVLQVDGWLPNPLLPNTRAELAVPISIGDNVLGVLDVQDNAVGGLSQTDVDLLQAIAGQVAIALQNARAYQLAQRQADREALIGNIGQQIQSTTSIRDALKVAARELGRALGTEVGVQLKHSDERTKGAGPQTGGAQN